MDQNELNLLLGVASNALTAIFAALARRSGRVLVGPQLMASIEREKASIRPVLATALDDVARTAPWSGPGCAEELALFLLSPEVESMMRQLYSAGLTGKSGASRIEEIRREFILSLAAYLGVEFQQAAPGAGRIFDTLLETCERLLQTAVEGGSLPAHEAKSALRYSLIADELANVERNLSLLLGKDGLDVKAILQFETQLRSQIAARHSYIIPPHFDSLTKVPIDDIYVPPSFETISLTRGEQPETYEMKEFLSSTYRRVVLGDPGCGKSTFATKLCHDLASGSGERLLMSRVLTPVLIILREYGAEKKERQTSLLSFIEKQAENRYMVRPPARAFEYLFLNGRAVVVFDGLDELLDTSYRLEISADIEAFCARYPAVPVMATSRTIGYEKAPLDQRRFSAVRISPFDERRVQDYVGKWAAICGDLTEKQEGQYVKSFLRESERVADLRSNPLMLALMCNLYRGDGYIPRNRPDVYEKCATMLFERWDKSRGIDAALPFEAHVRPAMMFLAHWIYSDTRLQRGVTESALVKRAAEYLAEHRFEDADEAIHAARAFTIFCTGRAWVFTDTGTTPAGEKLFQFTHRTFLEYFAAGHLVRTHPTPELLSELLLPHLKTREWDAVAQLAVQIQNKNVEGAADSLLGQIVETARHDPMSRTNLLDFAARCLEFLVPTPKTVRAVVEACVADAIPQLVASTRTTQARKLTGPSAVPVGSALLCAQENTLTVRKTLVESLVRNIKGTVREDSFGAGLVALALPFLGVLATGLSEPKEPWKQTLEDIWAQCELELTTLARDELSLALLALSCEHMTLEQLTGAHGGATALYRRMLLLGVSIGPVAQLLLDCAWRGRGRVPAALCSRLLTELGEIGERFPLPWIRPPEKPGIFRAVKAITRMAVSRRMHPVRFVPEYSPFMLRQRGEVWAPDSPAANFGAFLVLAVQAELFGAKWVEAVSEMWPSRLRERGIAAAPLWECIAARFRPIDDSALDCILDTSGLVGSHREFAKRWVRHATSLVG